MAGAPTVLDSPWGGITYAPPTAIDISALEQAIVGQLKDALGNVVEVAHYPDQPETYRLTHRIGAALVIFAGADYGEILSADLVQQERTLHFGVTVIIRDLGWSYGAGGGSPGAYQILEAIRLALTGFQPSGGGARKMWPTRERFKERDKQGGVWMYEIMFATTTRAIENFSAPAFPLFTTGIAQEEGGQTTIAAAPANYTFSAQNQIQLPSGNLSAVSVASLGGQLYAPGTDYSVDNVNGVVIRAAGGAIPALATVKVGYSYADVAEAIAAGGSAPFAPNN